MAADPGHASADLDAVVVGAGFSGLYMLHRLRDELGLEVACLEKADDVGGTWYWNRYPGARCDSESHLYCYSFDEDIVDAWDWSERYAGQEEVLEYLRFVADRLGLQPDIRFGTEVTAATFDADAGHWDVETADGDRVTARFLISAVGCLSDPYYPDFSGVEDFSGERYHTAEWPQEPVEFADKRVAVIGTGASGIQIIPEIAKRGAAELTVFQRTPNYAAPAGNRPIDDDEMAEIRENYADIWQEARNSGFGRPAVGDHESAADLSMAEVREILEPRWAEGGQLTLFGDIVTNAETNEKVSAFIRGKIREIVEDPETAETLVPTAYGYATKRPPLHTDYFETYNRETVHLVDVTEEPIERFTADGIRTAAAEYALDVVVLATGFDAMTGSILRMAITGREGRELAEAWADGPATYLGLMVHGFPNLFTITGPQSPSVLSIMPRSIEEHVEWVSDAIEHLDASGCRFMEPTAAAQSAWVSHTNAVAERTLYPEADSWYLGENIPGKPRVFAPYVGGFATYHDTIDEVAAKGYEGFVLSETVDGLAAEGDRPDLQVLAEEESAA